MRDQPIDFEAAKLDPGSVFEGPEAVVEHPDLSHSQKVEILRRWEYDAAELSVAEEEGMVGGEASLLDRILTALESMSASIDPDHSPPTKHGGLSRSDIKS